MDESTARLALFVRAHDQAPPSPLWTDADRRDATEAARAEVGVDAPAERFLEHRAAIAARRISARDPAGATLLARGAWRGWVGPMLIGLAFAAGVATDAIGNGSRINLLAPPLLGVLLWNLLMYVLIAIDATAGGDRLRAPFIRWVARWADGGRATLRSLRADTPPGSSVHADGPDRRFAADWSVASAPLVRARVTSWLHWAAAAFAAGALAGLYARGLAFEYRAGWESTFLEPSSVHALLSAILGPASALTGVPIADEARLAAMRFPGSTGENAAGWIHLYAVTVGAVVLLPRVVLALWQRHQAIRLHDRLPVDLGEAYVQGLVRQQQGRALAVRVLPYQVNPAAPELDALRVRLARALGPATTIDADPPFAFGDEDALAEGTIALRPVPSSTPVVAWFNLSATPEHEHHGAFARLLIAKAPAGIAPLAIVDETAFRRRFDEDRVHQRRAAWQKVLGAAGMAVAFVRLGEAQVDADGRSIADVFDATGSEAALAVASRGRDGVDR